MLFMDDHGVESMAETMRGYLGDAGAFADSDCATFFTSVSNNF